MSSPLSLTNRRRAERGTSLIEAMISLVILAIGILGVMQMSILASSQNAVAVRESAASFSARDMVDAIEQLPFDHPVFNVPPGQTQTVTIFDANTNALTTEWANARPLLGATPAIVTADVKTGNLAGINKITWTISTDASGKWKTIDILIQNKMPANRTRDLHVFTVKYSPAKMIGTGDVSLLTEI